MRVLIVAPIFGRVINGPTKLLHVIYHGLLAHNEISLEILTPQVPKVPMKYVHHLPLKEQSWRSKLPLNKLRTSMEYRSKIRSLIAKGRIAQPDAVLFADAVTGFWASILGMDGIPVLLMINDDDQILSSPRDLITNRRSRRRYLHRFFEKSAARNATLTIANSEYLREQIIRTYGTPRGKTTILRRGLVFREMSAHTDWPTFLAVYDKTPVDRIRRFSTQETLDILFVKEDYKRGGLPELFDALCSLKEFLFRLTIIGPATNPAKVLGWPPTKNVTVNFLGPQDQQSVLKNLVDSDIVCVPSKREALGNINMEALAAGVTVVSTAVGGIPEVLRHGKYGYLADNCTSSAIKEALYRAITDSPEARRDKISAGQAWVKTSHNADVVLRDFSSIIRAAVERNGCD